MPLPGIETCDQQPISAVFRRLADASVPAAVPAISGRPGGESLAQVASIPARKPRTPLVYHGRQCADSAHNGAGATIKPRRIQLCGITLRRAWGILCGDVTMAATGAEAPRNERGQLQPIPTSVREPGWRKGEAVEQAASLRPRFASAWIRARVGRYRPVLKCRRPGNSTRTPSGASRRMQPSASKNSAGRPKRRGAGGAIGGAGR